MVPAANITDRHPKESNNKVKGTPADKAPKMPRLSAKPVIMAKRFGINHWVDSFNMETQATPIDPPIISGYIRISQKPKRPRFSEIQGLALDCNVQIYARI